MIPRARMIPAHTLNQRGVRICSCAWRFLFILLLNILSLFSANATLAHLSELTETAASSRQVLLSMIEENPAEALRASLTGTLRAGLPSEVRTFLEDETEVEGVLEIRHEDREVGSRYLYFLEAGGTRYPLHFYDRHPDHLLTGAKIRVRGIRLDTRLALGGDTMSVQMVATAPVPNAIGEQRTLLILVNF